MTAKVIKPATTSELRDRIRVSSKLIGYELIVFLAPEARTDKKTKGAPLPIRIEVIDQDKTALVKRFEPIYRNISHFKVIRWTYAERYALIAQGRNKAVPTTSRRIFDDKCKFGHDNASLETEVFNRSQADFTAPVARRKK